MPVMILPMRVDLGGNDSWRDPKDPAVYSARGCNATDVTFTAVPQVDVKLLEVRLVDASSRDLDSWDGVLVRRVDVFNRTILDGDVPWPVYDQHTQPRTVPPQQVLGGYDILFGSPVTVQVHVPASVYARTLHALLIVETP